MKEELYTINHIVLLTGLTDRTIRNYIHLGLLKGEKINNLWHFTAEQVEEFVRNSAVRPSIRAKQNSVVYDFLIEDKKRSAKMCVILDLPDNDPKEVSEYFCYEISNGSGFCDLKFNFDSVEGTRIILSGPADQLMRLLNGFYMEKQGVACPKSERH